MSNMKYLSREIIKALDLVESIPTHSELYEGARVEITIRDKGTFCGVIDSIGGALFTLSGVSSYNEEDRLSTRELCFNIEDVVQVFSY